MNWGALGTATGWLPGAAGGAIIGALLSFMSWESLATDQCQVGTSALYLQCAHVLGATFDGYGEFLLAAVAVGGIVGAVLLALSTTFSSGDTAGT